MKTLGLLMRFSIIERTYDVSIQFIKNVKLKNCLQLRIELNMPVGVSWFEYAKFFTAAMFSMFVGAQMVHVYYAPLKDLDEYVDEERKRQASS
uniref:Uncharacterized protein n=1 Tax=Strigamia maritima TaxID=126957 RepID=T1JDA4_STRMM